MAAAQAAKLMPMTLGSRNKLNINKTNKNRGRQSQTASNRSRSGQMTTAQMTLSLSFTSREPQNTHKKLH